jgi:hypothetical protein
MPGYARDDVARAEERRRREVAVHGHEETWILRRRVGTVGRDRFERGVICNRKMIRIDDRDRFDGSQVAHRVMDRIAWPFAMLRGYIQGATATLMSAPRTREPAPPLAP